MSLELEVENAERNKQKHDAGQLHQYMSTTRVLSVIDGTRRSILGLGIIFFFFVVQSLIIVSAVAQKNTQVEPFSRYFNLLTEKQELSTRKQVANSLTERATLVYRTYLCRLMNREVMAAKLLRRQPPERQGMYVRATRHHRSGLHCFPPAASSVSTGDR